MYQSNNESSISALTNLWNQLHDLIIKYDTSYWSAFTVLTAIYGLTITYFKGNLSPEKIFDSKFWMLLFLPLITATVMNYVCNCFKWVSIARSLSNELEAKINELLGKNGLYKWNSQKVKEFTKLPNNRIVSPVVMLLLFSLLALFLVISAYNSSLSEIFKIIYSVAVVVLLIVSGISFFRT